MFSSSSHNTEAELSEIRRIASARRKALQGTEREAANAALTRRLAQFLQTQRPLALGSYRAYGSEADPAPAVAETTLSAELFLPKVVSSDTPLRFAAINANTQFQRSELGIDEPVGAATVSAASLELLLIPMLAFDRLGTRLGHGGGYYDRSLSECAKNQPLRVGVAFACQQWPQLPRRSWDQPLHFVVTEKEVITCPKN